ncbi:MAG: Flp pilus assembly protein CpaB [Chloroflexota bacterium]|nr:Flp pilus assembly protein CpaB [Chloroflexota bacterium]
MELEYDRPERRRKILIIVGIVLAIVAGGAAFVLVSGAQKQAAPVATKQVIVAARDVPARTTLQSSDLTLRALPDDLSLAQALTNPDQVIGRVTGVSLLTNQPVLANLLVSGAAGGKFSILGPEEKLTPDMPNWRAVSVSVPDDRAVGGQIQANQHVDLLVTVQVNVVGANTAQAQAPPAAGGAAGRSGATGPSGRNSAYYTDKSTKITYQDLVVLAKNGSFYILKVNERLAEEISHLQAAGNASFSMALRPEGDHRKVDTTNLGQTTNRIIEEYGIRIPEVYPKP